ncbi:hypothetical protein C7C46_12375 [Streptomyces tateyamensis]|uniref:Uncharacterized protein n=1 Tax=Streptomyces tateyamensis TaxID=565073 RepID=A0A2V4N8J9_9ACTN|nr:hypothetical protein [Streptomyces tateyamensis]PYC80492.1 hypothetical protein C7C46_12375 [Streptomyces tateyamensis]
MKSIVAGQRVFTALEFTELAFGLGLEPELLSGVPDESAEEWAARTDALRDILADLAEQDPQAAEFARALMKLAPAPLPFGKRSGRRPAWSAVAA